MTSFLSNASERSSVIVRALSAEDLSAVVAIHLEQFPHSRSSLLGQAFLRKMYRWFLTQQPDLSVVVELKGKPVGFAVGAIGGYGRRIFRYALPEVIWALVSKPSLLANERTFKAWKSLLRGLDPRFSATSQPGTIGGNGIVKASLASIGVSRVAQGKGFGKTALGAFEDAAKAKGASELGLSVERDNIAARRLYEACGWELRRNDASSGSAYYGKCLIAPVLHSTNAK